MWPQRRKSNTKEGSFSFAIRFIGLLRKGVFPIKERDKMNFYNNDLPVRLLTLMLAALMCTSMSGCRGTAEVSAGSESTDAHIAESTAVTTQNNIKNSVSSNSDSYLPEGYSMEDLKNMLTINGKSISLPTTPEKFIEILGDGYTYELDDMGLDLTIYGNTAYIPFFKTRYIKTPGKNAGSIDLCTSLTTKAH